MNAELIDLSLEVLTWVLEVYAVIQGPDPLHQAVLLVRGTALLRRVLRVWYARHPRPDPHRL